MPSNHDGTYELTFMGRKCNHNRRRLLYGGVSAVGLWSILPELLVNVASAADIRIPPATRRKNFVQLGDLPSDGPNWIEASGSCKIPLA